MKGYAVFPSWFDRLFCRLFHHHLVTTDRDGNRSRKCLVFGCGILVRLPSAMARRMRAARKAAARAIGGGR
jgi:hypothetical protein